MTMVCGSPRRYFNKKGTLLFTLSKRQRDLLAHLPARIPADADGRLRHTVTVLSSNGLISLDCGGETELMLTPAGRAAIAFYDFLIGLEGK